MNKHIFYKQLQSLLLITGWSFFISPFPSFAADFSTCSASTITRSRPPQEAIFVEGTPLKIIGSTVFKSQDFKQALQAAKINYQSEIDNTIINSKIADIITQLYADRQYITSKAIAINNVIEITEGSLESIQIKGTQRLNPAYLCDRIQRASLAPLNTQALEEQLRLLKADPLFSNVEAVLQESGQPGRSILRIKVTEASRFSSGVTVNNYAPPAVGAERFGIELRYRNLTGRGDELSGAYSRSFTGGLEVFDLSYQVPLNALDGTLQFRIAPNRNQITQSPFDQLGIRGKQQVYEVNYRQPLVRSSEQELALSLGFTYQQGQTFLFDQLPRPFGLGPDADGVSRTSVLKFGQEYVKRDAQGAWALRSQFNLGIGIFNATTNADPIPDGRFISWSGQIQRGQRLGDRHLLLAQAEVQLTPHSLLPAQQFVIGGGQSIRGYRQNARSGDNGFRFSLEDRISIAFDKSGVPSLQLIPFVEVGKVWNQAKNPNRLPEQTLLGSAGLGVLWDRALGLKGLSLRLDYGFPFIQLDDRGSNLQDNGFYFSVRYQPR
ncbi:MAG: peptide ABC transporter permease [Alkalinema sp. CACIAM 70d]|nr:MAG: peptide ABC transporter permease [Alkalinema sp. CACIAM 70d]